VEKDLTELLRASTVVADGPALEGIVVDDNIDDDGPVWGLAPAMPSITWTDEQNLALDKIGDWHGKYTPYLSLTGPAGVGKTTLLREVIRRFPHATLTAMTGKAALRMQQLAGREATTLHAKLYEPPKLDEKKQYKELFFTVLRDAPSSLVVIDEASMCTPAIFEDLQRWGCRILFVGDSYQLPPVITGEELKKHGEDYSVFAHVRGAELVTVMRNAGGVLRAATQVRETGLLCSESHLDSQDEGYEFIKERDPIERAVDDYLNDPNDHLLITWKNVNRMQANRMIRERLGHEGPLPDEGEPVLIKKNGGGFLNGQIVKCGGFESGPKVGSMRTLWMKINDLGFEQRLLVSFEGGRDGEMFDGQMPWLEDWRHYHADLRRLKLDAPTPITWGYCLTAHSAQGSEARRATVFLGHGDERNRNFNKETTLPSGEKAKFSARFLYTSLTRGKKSSRLIVAK
jgi:ATP-dependent exoDNAse (exonuclease V) alpha subunit